MVYTEHYCHECQHWTWTGITTTSGSCEMQSSRCATHITQHKEGQPPWYLPMKDVWEEESS